MHRIHPGGSRCPGPVHAGADLDASSLKTICAYILPILPILFINFFLFFIWFVELVSFECNFV